MSQALCVGVVLYLEKRSVHILEKTRYEMFEILESGCHFAKPLKVCINGF